MARSLLPEVRVRNAKPSAKEYLLADGDGLFLRVRPNGARTWIFVYSLGKKQRKHGLGSYPAVSLSQARDYADEARGCVGRGVSPPVAKRQAEEQRQQAEAALAARPTLRSIFEEWMLKEGNERNDGGDAVRRAMEKDIVTPERETMFADEVGRRHIIEALDSIVARGSKRMVKDTLQIARQMFKFAVLRELIPSDPTYGLKKSDFGGPAVERDRTLTIDEIRQLADILPTANMDPRTEAALWAILATLVRVGEITKAKWSELDLGAGTWTIPEENSKNGRRHTVHLSPFAKKKFEFLLSTRTSATWIFPNTADDGPLCYSSIGKQVHDRQTDKPGKNRCNKTSVLRLPGGRWTPHDLRRTGATLMGELGIRDDVIDRCLNHVEENKVRRTYQRQTLLPEREQAFMKLGAYLTLLSRGTQLRDAVEPVDQAA